jgi:hypothetical protein
MLDTVPPQPQLTLKVESGSAFVNRNDQRIPGSSGSDFSMTDVTGRGGFRFSRVELTWQKNDMEEWRFLYAPFRISGSGALGGPVNFQDATFAAGAASGTYQFNSYRLTYRRPWFSSERRKWKFGYTLKVRDAEVTLRQGALSRSELDPRGIVPLLHVSGFEEMGNGWSATFDFDGLAGGPGRAFDIGVQLNKRINDRQDLYFGLRTLEGGADVPRVYSFAWVNYASIGLTTRF